MAETDALSLRANNAESQVKRIQDSFDEYKKAAGGEEKRLRKDIEAYEAQKSEEDHQNKQMKIEFEIQKG